MREIVVLGIKDNVATTLEDLNPGESVCFKSGNKKIEITVLNKINYGHKFAIIEIKKGHLIIKYGEVIGTATSTIKIGEHVHVHNVIGNRARSVSSKIIPNNFRD